MHHRARVVLSTCIVLAVASLTSTPAAASWTVECIWGKFPAKDRASLTDAKAGEELPLSVGPALTTAASSCGATDKESELVAQVVVIYTRRNSALEQFHTAYGVRPEDILKEWQGLPAGDRAKLGAYVIKMEYNDEGSALYLSLARQLIQRLGVTDPEAGYPLRALVLSLGGLEGFGRGGLSKP